MRIELANAVAVGSSSSQVVSICSSGGAGARGTQSYDGRRRRKPAERWGRRGPVPRPRAVTLLRAGLWHGLAISVARSSAPRLRKIVMQLANWTRLQRHKRLRTSSLALRGIADGSSMMVASRRLRGRMELGFAASCQFW